MAAQRSEPLDPAPSGTPGAVGAKAAIGAVLERALSVRVADYEDATRAEAEALRLVVRDVLQQSLGIIAVIGREYDVLASPGAVEDAAPGGGRTLCEAVDQHDRRPSGVEKVADLAFVASIGLRSRLASVDAVARVEEKWDVVAECSGAIREVLKSLSALERAVCACEGVPPASSYYVTELERALRTRRAYVRLRQDVVVAVAPEGEGVPPRLRRVAAAIAKLASRDIYISARVNDRRLVREVQQRIRAWLAVEPTEVSGGRQAWLREGARLYQDVANLCDLILSINHRAELCAHDAEILEASLPRLRARANAAIAPLAEFPGLEQVIGRDAELDARLLASSPVDAAELAELVERPLRALRGR